MTISDCILVTGATGFIGAHCVGILLDRNFKVKAHSRSLEKFSKLKESIPYSKQHLLEPAIISDITNQDELFEHMKYCTGVLHLASPFKFAVDNFVEDLLVPALKGTEAVMKAAHISPDIKRVVLTSSFAAVYDASKGDQEGVVLTEDDFSPLTWEDGASTKNPAVAYRASKTIAEKSAWEFMKVESPKFDLCVLCPTMVFGPLYSTKLISDITDLNFSNQLIWQLMKSSDGVIPPTRNPVWVDVRDLAEYHVTALTSPEASNQRFLISAGDYDNQEIVDLLRENLPEERLTNVPLGTPGHRITGSHYTTDSSKGINLLAITYRSLKSSILDLHEQLYTFMT